MARILIVTMPGDGHFPPLATVAEELINRGHTIWWYTGKEFQSKIEQIGCIYKPMSAAYDFGGMNRQEAYPQLEGLQGLSALIGCWKHIFLEEAPKQMEDILKLLDEFPADMIVTDETCFAPGFLREKTGIPVVVVAITIYLLFSSKDTAPFGLGLWPDSSWLGQIRNFILHFFVDRILLRQLRGYTDRIRAKVGLPKLNKSVLESVTQPPDLYLLGTVPEFEYPRSDMYEHTHFVGSLVKPPLKQFDPPVWWDDLRSKKPVVFVTQGTVSNDDLNALLIPTIRALADEEVLVVATTGKTPAESLASLPPNARVERFIPYYFLLQHVDVMITNGGYNGVQMALSNGVPLIMAGTTEEKGEIAAHVAWAGVGINLKTQTPSQVQIRNAVKTILRDSYYKNNALRLQIQYKNYDGQQRAADLIEQLLEKKQSAQYILVN